MPFGESFLEPIKVTNKSLIIVSKEHPRHPFLEKRKQAGYL